MVWTTLLACLLGAWLFIRRFARLRADGPGADELLPDAPVLPGDVSIIVPARNEAHNLPTLLRSLRALSPAPHEIIVVDDHSSDGTGELAARYGVRVVVPGALREGYVGKTWACLAGAEVASGSALLFTDADTWHAPDSLARSTRVLAGRGVGFVSVVATHRIRAGWEHLQGVFQLLLLVATRASSRGERGERQNYANGQYLLFTRAVYEQLGGHRAVRGYVAEDLAFVAAARTLGREVRLVWAPGALCARMYPEGFAAFFAGWRRNFREGMSAGGLSSIAEVSVTIAWLLGVPLLLVDSGLAGHWSVWSWLFVYLSTAVLVARAQGPLGRFCPASALAYPLFVGVFVAVSLCSAFDGLRKAPIAWRGRSIVR
jgi:4,4'-diaponeurosporenoate glycosyltransferase